MTSSQQQQPHHQKYPNPLTPQPASSQQQIQQQQQQSQIILPPSTISFQQQLDRCTNNNDDDDFNLGETASQRGGVGGGGGIADADLESTTNVDDQVEAYFGMQRNSIDRLSNQSQPVNNNNQQQEHQNNLTSTNVVSRSSSATTQPPHPPPSASSASSSLSRPRQAEEIHVTEEHIRLIKDHLNSEKQLEDCKRTILQLQLGLLSSGRSNVHQKTFRKFFLEGFINPYRCCACLRDMDKHAVEASSEMMKRLSPRTSPRPTTTPRVQNVVVVDSSNVNEEIVLGGGFNSSPNINSNNTTENTGGSLLMLGSRTPKHVRLGENSDFFQNDRLRLLCHLAVVCFLAGIIMLIVYFVIEMLPTQKPVMFIPPFLLWIGGVLISLRAKRRRLEFDKNARVIRCDLRPIMWYFLFSELPLLNSNNNNQQQQHSSQRNDQEEMLLFGTENNNNNHNNNSENNNNNTSTSTSTSSLAPNLSALLLRDIDFDKVINIVSVPIQNNAEQPDQSYWSVELVYYRSPKQISRDLMSPLATARAAVAQQLNSNNNQLLQQQQSVQVINNSMDTLVKERLCVVNPLWLLETVELETVREFEKDDVVQCWREYCQSIGMELRDR